MYLPHWLILSFAWITFSVLTLTALTLMGWLVVWCCELLQEQFQYLLGFLGYWAAFWNYIQVMLSLPTGSRLYPYQYIKPIAPFHPIKKEQEEMQKRLDRTPEDWAIFDIVPHPEAYRWWMWFFGLKKPSSITE
jgi:hypothetical protein